MKGTKKDRTFASIVFFTGPIRFNIWSRNYKKRSERKFWLKGTKTSEELKFTLYYYFSAATHLFVQAKRGILKNWTPLIIESYGMSLKCHDTWYHLLTSFLVENDVKLLLKWHDILMELNRIFMRQSHPRKMPWECHAIPMSFNGIQNFGSVWWYFYGKSRWNCHGIWRHFWPKLRWDEMMAFYYEGWLTFSRKLNGSCVSFCIWI